MSTVARSTTADELMRMPNFPPHALFEGELVAMSPAGGEHGFVAANIGANLWDFVRKNRLGNVYCADTGYLLARNPDTVLAPDASFIAKGRIPTGKDHRGYMPLAPDLAVEVVSPNDRRGEVERKIAKWLDAGTQMVWVIWTDKELVSVHQSGAAVEEFGLGETIEGGEVLPGFSLQVDDVFG